MKKLLSLLVISSFCVLGLFLGCDFSTPPEVPDNPYSTDLEQKDVLALKHLQIPNISEATLASYVMDFIKNVSAAPEAGTGRGVQSTPAPAVVIAKAKEIIHTVQTGFAETTADKRSARSIIGPGRIPFYVFTLENQLTGKTGFALACGDNRIGNILAVAEEGNYDDDNPFMSVFYSQLDSYIENTIAIYNSVTEADIQNALNKINENTRATAPDLPVTEVGKIDKLKGDRTLLDTVPIRWSQGYPYNEIINGVFHIPQEYKDKYQYVTGCVPTAIAIIMAYHGRKRADSGLSNPYSRSQITGFNNVEYDWRAMTNGTDDNAIAVLMYEIGLPKNANSTYSMGPVKKADDPLKKKEGASTSTMNNNARYAYRNMGYIDPGNFKKYETSGIKSSIDKDEPAQVVGYSKMKTYIFGIQIPDNGHSWVIDGYAEMSTTAKNKYTSEPENYIAEFVHCNIGWGESSIDAYGNYTRPNGWYVSGVFDTYDIPEATRSTEQAGFYQYNIQMLTGIRPK